MVMARQPNVSRQTQALLIAMLEEPSHWRHGYDLSRQTALKSGTLYPILMRLSDQGLLESKWLEPERPGKPARHAYRLTLNGLAFARTLSIPAPQRAGRRKIIGASA